VLLVARNRCNTCSCKLFQAVPCCNKYVLFHVYILFQLFQVIPCCNKYILFIGIVRCMISLRKVATRCSLLQGIDSACHLLLATCCSPVATRCSVLHAWSEEHCKAAAAAESEEAAEEGCAL